MKTISKKLLSLLLVVIMVASVIPFQAFADAAGHVDDCVDKDDEAKLTYVAAKCGTDGNVEHWKCNTCGAVFHSDKSNWSKNDASVVKTGVPADHTWGTATTYTNAACGMKTCTFCGTAVIVKADGTLGAVLPAGTTTPPAHNFTTVQEESGTCAIKYCTGCGAAYILKADGTLGAELPAGTTTAPAHVFTTTSAATDDECGVETCSTCGAIHVLMASGAAGAKLASATAPAHTVDGNGTCSTCGKTGLLTDGADYTVTITIVDKSNPSVALMGPFTKAPAEVKVSGQNITTFAADADAAFARIAGNETELSYDVSKLFTANKITIAGTEYTFDSVNKAGIAGSATKVYVRNLNTHENAGFNDITVYVINPSDTTDRTVTFHAAPGKFVGGTDDGQKVVARVAVAGLLPSSTPNYSDNVPGYTKLGGWNLADGTYYSYQAGQKISTNLDLYARYSEQNCILNVWFCYENGTVAFKSKVENVGGGQKLDAVLTNDKLDAMVKESGLGVKILSYGLYSNAATSASYASGTTVGEANANGGVVCVRVQAKSFTAHFTARDSEGNEGLIGNATYKDISIKYGEKKTMPIPVLDGKTFVGWREETSGDVYTFVKNTELTFVYPYDRDATFVPVWDTSAGVYVKIFFNNITNRSVYTVQIYDLKPGETLTVNKVTNLINRYFTWTSTSGLVKDADWNAFVTSGRATGSDYSDVGITLSDAKQQTFCLMLYGAKQNGITITNANLSTIGIGVNANGAYAPADPTNPKTGNEAEMLGVAMASMVMAVITLAGVTYYTRKKEEMI